MSDVIRLCRKLESMVAADAPLRVRTLVEMLLIELERLEAAPRPPVVRTAANPSEENASSETFGDDAPTRSSRMPV